MRLLHHVQRVGDGADGGAKDGAGEEAGDEEDGDLALVKLVLLIERVDVRALQPVPGCGAPQRSVALVRAGVGPGHGTVGGVPIMSRKTARYSHWNRWKAAAPSAAPSAGLLSGSRAAAAAATASLCPRRCR